MYFINILKKINDIIHTCKVKKVILRFNFHRQREAKLYRNPILTNSISLANRRSWKPWPDKGWDTLYINCWEVISHGQNIEYNVRNLNKIKQIVCKQHTWNCDRLIIKFNVCIFQCLDELLSCYRLCFGKCDCVNHNDTIVPERKENHSSKWLNSKLYRKFFFKKMNYDK